MKGNNMEKRKPGRPKKVKNEMPNKETIFNGLSQAIMGFDPLSTGAQLSQVDTIFNNNRWYLISNMRQVLSEIYIEHGIIQTVVDVPVDDAFRGGVEIKSKQLSSDQLEKLQVLVEREDIIDSVVAQAMKWNRLYGGAGVVIITDQDPTTPLDLDAIGPDSQLEFRAVDMWELFWDKQNTEGYNPQIQEQDYDYYSYYGVKLHKSRVMKMKGMKAPSFLRPRLRGWGFSVVESLVRSINQYLKANDLAFEVLDEFKIDIYKIKGLTSTLLSADGTSAIQRRVSLANQQKNFQNAISMDSEDDYQQKQLSFAGLADIMREIRMQIASDLRMPLTKIFGISSTGFNAGEEDLENYNSMVESQVRNKSKYDILRILELMCKKEFGMVPDDLSISFQPLRMLSAEQEENVKTQKFNRLIQAKQAGEITSEEFRDACNKDDLMGIQLEDTNLDILEMQKGLEAKEPDDDQEDIGSSEPDSQQGQLANDIGVFVNPGDIDEGVWDKAKKACMKAYGHLKYAVVMSIYKKMKGIE